MHSSFFRKVTIVTFIFILLSGFAFATSNSFVTLDLRDVEKKAEELRAKYKAASDVVVAFDIDNTLLKMEKELGSEQWFDWQEKLLNDPQEKENRVGENFQELLFANGLILDKASMNCPQGEVTKTVFGNLQKNGHKILILTSRGHNYEFDTFRELYENGIHPELSALMKQNDADASMPYNPATVQKDYGFSDNEYTEFKLGSAPRNVLYTRGVFFTAGQHKGAMMRIILKKANLNPKAIIFVDDKEKHTQRMQDAFKNSSIELITYRYSAMDAEIAKFNAGNKKKVVAEWKALSKAYEGTNYRSISNLTGQ
jgi:hypothetical protein